MATSLIENRQFVGLVALLVAAAVLVPYFSPQGFAVADNRADLTVTSVSLPDAMQHNVPFTAKATFANLGDGWATRVTYKYEVWNQYNLVYARVGVVDHLAAGQQAIVSLPIEEQVAGTYTLKVLIDSEYEHAESDESDNTYKTAFTII